MVNMTTRTKTTLGISALLLAFLWAVTPASARVIRKYPPQKPEPLREALLSPMDSAPAAELPKGAKKAPWLNEKMRFAVSWGFITVGYAEMNTENIVLVDSVPCYHIVSTAQSTSFVDTFFKVRDRNQTWITYDNFYSKGYTKLIREGTYFWDEWVSFDYSTNTFTGQKRTREGAIEPTTGQIPGPVQDIFSALYFVRTLDLKVGQSVEMDVNSRQNWPLIVSVLKTETVKVPAGKFDCILVEPKLRDKGLFVQKGKSLKVWISNDKRRIPVKMEAEVFIGNVSVELEEYSGEPAK
jgi:hypothetical protein